MAAKKVEMMAVKMDELMVAMTVDWMVEMMAA